jgi:hypothetical protein
MSHSVLVLAASSCVVFSATSWCFVGIVFVHKRSFFSTAKSAFIASLALAGLKPAANLEVMLYSLLLVFVR